MAQKGEPRSPISIQVEETKESKLVCYLTKLENVESLLKSSESAAVMEPTVLETDVT